MDRDHCLLAGSISVRKRFCYVNSKSDVWRSRGHKTTIFKAGFYFMCMPTHLVHPPGGAHG